MIITPLYAGLLALIFLILSIRVIQKRGQGISLGDGGDDIMLRRIRAHGNFSEYVPFILLMIAILEMGRFPGYLIHALGIALVVARALHGYSLAFTEKYKFGRMWGAALTLLLLVICGGLCLYQGVNAALILN